MSRFILIAGPCVIESEENVMLIAETMKGITERLKLDYYFKASFDKCGTINGFNLPNSTSSSISCSKFDSVLSP